MPNEATATLNLASLLKRDPSVYELADSGSFFLDEGYMDEFSIEKPLSWRVRVQSTGDSEFLLTGSVWGEVLMPCRRCLEDTLVNSRADFVYSLHYQPGLSELDLVEQEDDEDYLVFGRPAVDLGQFLSEIFVVDLPLTAVCQDASTCKDLSLLYNNQPSEKQTPFANLVDIELES
ncbi:MAG: DUF177 domain-containing protein [Deinococcales bacterium]